MYIKYNNKAKKNYTLTRDILIQKKKTQSRNTSITLLYTNIPYITTTFHIFIILFFVVTYCLHDVMLL